jgi:hypothetical protein
MVTDQKRTIVVLGQVNVPVLSTIAIGLPETSFVSTEANPITIKGEGGILNKTYDNSGFDFLLDVHAGSYIILGTGLTLKIANETPSYIQTAVSVLGGSTLVINGADITGCSAAAGSSHGIVMDGASTLYLKAGTLSHFSGQGVLMGNVPGNNTFYMSGGTISHNYTQGVSVTGDSRFEMTGGDIEYNENSTMYGGEGGGVYVRATGYFIMYDPARIQYNKAVKGGGVFLSGSSTFTMSNGFIVHNLVEQGGGGVGMDGGTFTMIEGAISANENSGDTAYAPGGGVFVDGGTFNTLGGELTGNKSTSGAGVWVGPGGHLFVGGSANI